MPLSTERNENRARSQVTSSSFTFCPRSIRCLSLSFQFLKAGKGGGGQIAPGDCSLVELFMIWKKRERSGKIRVPGENGTHDPPISSSDAHGGRVGSAFLKPIGD